MLSPRKAFHSELSARQHFTDFFSLNSSKRNWINELAILVCFKIKVYFFTADIQQPQLVSMTVRCVSISSDFPHTFKHYDLAYCYVIVRRIGLENKQVEKSACNFQWMARAQSNYTIVFWWHLLFPKSNSRVCTVVPVTLFYSQEDLDPCLRGIPLWFLLQC